MKMVSSMVVLVGSAVIGLWLCGEEFEGGSVVVPKRGHVCVFCLRKNQGRGRRLVCNGFFSVFLVVI